MEYHELIKTQSTEIQEPKTMEIRFQGQKRFFLEQDIQSLPDIVKREILHPKLNDKEFGQSERQKLTMRLITMLSIKFDAKSEFSRNEDLSPQEIAMAEFGSFIRQYQLTGEEVLEAYRMGIRKQLLDLKGNVIQVYPNLSIIQAGEILNAYQEYKIENHQHTKGHEKLKLLINPVIEPSPEEIKARKKELLQKLVDAVKENKPCAHSFLFFDYVIRKGGLKSFLDNKKAQEIVVRKKTIEILTEEKRKGKSVLFSVYELNRFSAFFKSNSDEILEEMKFAFDRLQAMAITHVKGDLAYNWFKKEIKKSNKC